MEDLPTILWRDDHQFLLYFITGVYFGPDLKKGRPQKSALQRRAEGLPQYHANDLAGSYMKATEIEKVYCYLLREAKQPALLMQSYLFQYLQGIAPHSLTSTSTYLQFDELFPPNLHHRYLDENQHLNIGNIFLINHPEIWYMKPGDIKRFKRLTRLEDFVLDREMHKIVDENVLYDPTVHRTSKLDDTLPHLDVHSLEYFRRTEKIPYGNRPSNSSVPCSSSVDDESQASIAPLPSQMNTISGKEIDHGMIFLPSCPSTEEWGNLVATINGGFGLTGSAAKGNVGPVLGMMDIGESEDSYLFRVSLPGVRREEKDFSCEVDCDGTVIIKGVTVTGEIEVEKYSQVFEMRSRNLCPPGPFSISFKLPGPVDHLQFHGTFACDGILEGMILKAKDACRR